MKKNLKNIKIFFQNLKSIEWAKPIIVLKGIGSVVLFTGFFIALFTLIDFIGTLVSKIGG